MRANTDSYNKLLGHNMATPLSLPRGLRGLKASPKQHKSLHNLIYASQDSEYLMLRPAVDKILELDGICRGMGVFRDKTTGDEQLYGVFGSFLYRIEVTNPIAGKRLSAGDITTTQISSIAGTAECRFAAGFSYMVVMAVGGSAYAYDGSTVTEITHQYFKTSVSVAYDAGRFIFIPENGEPFFWSNPDDPLNYQQEDYADGEEYPDPNKQNFVRRGIHYVLGTRTVEASQYSPSLQSYPRVSSVSSKVGFVGGLTSFGESFAFLGQNSQGGFEIYAMNDEPTPISNKAVSELINSEYYLSELKDVKASHFIWNGTPLLVFSLPRHTIAYYGDWSFFHTGIAGQEQSTWRPNAIQYAYGYLWVGDSIDGSLGNLVSETNEAGKEIEWRADTFIKGSPEQNFLLKFIYGLVTQGNDENARVALSTSRDGKIYGKEVYKNLGNQGNYNHLVKWGSPIGTYPDFCALRFRGYGSKTINIDGLFYE